MQVIGFNLSKIMIERKENLNGKIEISQNIDIKNLSKEKISISKNEAVKITFSFNIDYKPDFAKLDFEGYVLMLPEEHELKNIMKSWKEKKLPEEIRIPVFNFIMGKCNIKALNLEDEMSLPYHVPMPRLAPNNQENQ